MRLDERWLTQSEERLLQRVQRWLYRHGLAKPVMFFVFAVLTRAAETVHSTQVKVLRKLRPLHPARSPNDFK